MNTNTPTQWTNFNDADTQMGTFDLLPKGLVVPVRMTIKPGGYIDPQQEWMDSYPTLGQSGAAFLKCEYVVLSGEFAKRKLWGLIGLYSPKGPTWGDMGRAYIRAILNSAFSLKPDDITPAAAARRRIRDFGDLDGIEFVARIDVEKDMNDVLKNTIKSAVEPGHQDYAIHAAYLKNVIPGSGGTSGSAAPATVPTPAVPAPPAVTGKPAWAQ